MLNQVSPGLSQDGSTGLFEGDVIYTVKLRGDREIRYKTAYELGYIVGSNGLDFDNPYDPINTEVDEFDEGLWAGQEDRKAGQQTGQR
jgi:hypothetical protein